MTLLHPNGAVGPLEPPPAAPPRATRPDESRDGEAGSVVPCIRLFADQVVVDRSDGLGADWATHEVPLIALSFDYDGQRLRASDPQARFFRATDAGLMALGRDEAAEVRARRILESFGAVDLECLDDYAVSPDVDADYVVRCEGDVHDYCAFGAWAVPQLRRLGFRVEVDPGFPYRVVDRPLPWYAAVEPEPRRTDWFALELGVEIDGRRVNLLPALLDLLDDDAGARGLRSLVRSARHVALEVDDGLFMTVPSEHIRALLRVLTELYRGEWTPSQAMRFSGVQAGALHDLDVAFRGAGLAVDWRGGERVRSRGRSLRGVPAAAPPPPDLRATLRPYQQQGLDWLQHLRARGAGGILADDMGLGKTLQTIAHIAIEKASGRLVHPALVVAPTSLVAGWTREIGKFAPTLRAVAFHGGGRRARWPEARRADVIVTSYPLLVRDEALLASQRYHLIVLDEAQTVKNCRSQASRAVRALEAEHRLCLTGTPVENHLGELWSLVDFLEPGLLGDEGTFSRYYRSPIERLGDEERLEALRGLLAPFILRRLKDQVARELPPKTELFRPVELSGKQRELYESIRVSAHGTVRKIIKQRGLSASTPSILSALMKLRQLCCDPRLLPMEAARFVRESAKYDLCFELLERQLAEGHRVLLFSQFTSMLGLIAKGLRERGVRFVSLTGSTPDRQKVVDTFERGDADVFLISLKAGGTGLTLTSADTVIHYDPWWNPAAQAQATDRAYRIGQSRPVFVHTLFVAGSVEERILGLQRRKQHLADAILGAGSRRAALTEDELDVLFAPLGA